ncbi:MAG: hypothetical protein JWP75_2353 [Frondihabitans sp.]|nr:hypothetical protein [Frondihabitans sp.]
MLRPFTRPSTVVAFGIAAIVVVVAFGFLISKTEAMTNVDLRIDKALNHLHTGFLGALGSGVYWLFEPTHAVLITLVVALVIWARSKNLRLAVTFAFVVGFTWLASDVVKLLVHRDRPDPAALLHPFSPEPVDPSFPSGHAVFVATMIVALYLLARGTSFRTGIVLGGIAVAIVAAFALLSDGVHYPSDVLASYAWSVGVAPLVLLGWNRFVLPRTYRAARSADVIA